MGKIILKCETITPLFTGDCNQEMTEIKPASIMGSLRFWFEVICHFSGKFNKEEYSKNELNAKEFKEFIKNKPDATDEDIQRKFELTPTAFYFGCTGWKSQIGIEKIEPIKDYCYGNRMNLPFGILYSDKEKQWIDLQKWDSNCNNYSNHCWFLPQQYFWGKFQITFSLSDSSLKDNILFPLLRFIQEYGFLGGKNNLGFGRVKILEPSIANREMKIFKETIDYSSLIKSNKLNEKEMNKLSTYIFDKMEVLWLEQDKKENENKPAQTGNKICAEIEKYEDEHFDQSISYLGSIKCLLFLKSKMRKNIGNKFQRHYFFGSTSEKREFFFNWSNKKYENVSYPNATKIIPLIRKHERGFLVIPGIINMEEINNGTE